MTKLIPRRAAQRRAKRAIERVCREEIPAAYGSAEIQERLIEAVSEALQDRQHEQA